MNQHGNVKVGYWSWVHSWFPCDKKGVTHCEAMMTPLFENKKENFFVMKKLSCDSHTWLCSVFSSTWQVMPEGLSFV